MAGLNDPDFWPKVADTIGSNNHYTYDLGDRSHLLDVVQIVCQAAAKVLPDAPDRRWWITTDNLVNDQTKVSGPYSTRDDALTARAIKEQYSDGQTYWVMEK